MKMKNFWFFSMIIMVLTMWSCSSDDDYTNFQYVARGIDSISMPDSARYNERVEIKTYTTTYNGCEVFQTHGVDAIGYERTVVTWFMKYGEVECDELVAIEPSFYFLPRTPGTYQFRFWAGQDDETGEDVFINKEIVIVR